MDIRPKLKMEPVSPCNPRLIRGLMQRAAFPGHHHRHANQPRIVGTDLLVGVSLARIGAPHHGYFRSRRAWGEVQTCGQGASRHSAVDKFCFMGRRRLGSRGSPASSQVANRQTDRQLQTGVRAKCSRIGTAVQPSSLPAKGERSDHATH